MRTRSKFPDKSKLPVHCSVCGRPGHNRRTCTEKGDKKKLVLVAMKMLRQFNSIFSLVQCMV